MPKVVDAEQRRAAVADAVVRVAVTHGLPGASLRGVAAEAGLNIGSVRHYFESHRELFRFAMSSIIDRTGDRVRRRLDESADPGDLPVARRAELALELLSELLPLDPERRAESVVLLEFLVAARKDDTLDALAVEALGGVNRLARAVLASPSFAIPPRRLDIETHRLAALIDGLTLRACLHPEVLTAEDAHAVLAAHLSSLTARAG